MSYKSKEPSPVALLNVKVANLSKEGLPANLVVIGFELVVNSIF